VEDSAPITVSITRRVKPGSEEAFERALHKFVQRSLVLPGQMGVHIMRPAPGSGSREYGIVRKFSSRDALAAFRTSSEYLEWNHTALDLTEGDGRVEELTGLESWFTLPGATLRPLPKWKMAIVTLLGVFPTSLLLGETVGRWMVGWPLLLRSLVFASLMVALLTWVVMPLLTRILHNWFYPEDNRHSP
jgi:antibiotic biosynthesis monooxygenase (ABM) superfamily enzyme